MKITFSLLFVLFSFSSFAGEKPHQVNSMLEQMVRENVISASAAEKVKIRATIVARSPASFSDNTIHEVHGIDLDGAQFNEIQSEMRRIVPNYRD